MVVYPNPDSWDEFYPSEIFMKVAALASIADFDTSLIVLSKWIGQQG